MAEKKQHTYVSADTNKPTSKPKAKKTTTTPSGKTAKEAAPVGNATGYRIAAVALWVVAIVCEILAVLLFAGKLNWTFMNTLALIIILLVVDLACVIAGAQFWKKANHIDPASEKNPVKFWLWNNMGVIVCAFAFIPFIILALTDKNADKQTKTIATVAAVIALLIGGVASYDFNPVSAEQKQEAMSVLGDEQVFWTTFGKVYHTHDDCQALNNSDALTYGNVEQAIAAHRTRLCAFCAKRDDITGVVTDKAVDEIGEIVQDAVDDAA